MNTYDKVKAVIEAWHYAVLQHKDNDYCIAYAIDSDWSILRSDWSNDIEIALDHLDGFYDNEDEINEFKFIKVIPRPIKYYKPWDKVMIMDNVKDIPWYDHWDNEYKEMIWWPYEIKSVDTDGTYPVYTKDKSDFYWFPHHVLAPYFEGETMSGKKVKVTIDWKEYEATID